MIKYEKIGRDIKKYRKKNKITQVKLANLINKSESSVQKYEKGEVEIPNSVLINIAQVLDISFDDLVGLELKTNEHVIYQDKDFIIISNTREVKESYIDRIKYDLLMDTKEVE